MTSRLFACSLLACALAGACAADSPDTDHVELGDTADVDAAPATEDPTVVARAAAWSTFAFARVAPIGAITAQFNSESTATATISHLTTGAYTITFPALGDATTDAGSGGNVQLVSEGLNNFRCRIMGWSGSSNLSITVRCARPDGTSADAAFAVMFTRKIMEPTPPVFPAGEQGDTAYAWVTSGGAIPNAYGYNSTGVANWARKTSTGVYMVVFPGLWRGVFGFASAPNSSLTLSTYAGADPGAMCTVDQYSVMYQPPYAPLGLGVIVYCYDRSGAPVDSAFTIASSTSGPPWGQQSGHAWLYQLSGTIHSDWVDTWGRNGACSDGTVTAAFANPHVRVTVAGDLGNVWPSDPPVQRLSFATPYRLFDPEPMYCKVESVTSTGAPPTSSSVTTIHCYDEIGTTTMPELFFTHVLDQVGLPLSGCD